MLRFVLGLLLFFPYRGMTQLVLMPGCSLHVQANAQLYLNDSLHIEPLALLNLNGEAWINGSVINHGVFEWAGNLFLGENLIQSGVLNATPTSRLITVGELHLLGGDSSIALGVWENSGSGMRRILRDVSVNQLQLDSVRLFTGNFALRLNGNNQSSLSRSGGWVISGLNGAFFRNLSASEAFLFPVGDSLRYRPVQIETPTATVLGLRYAEASAVSEGLPVFLSDPLICSIDPQFNYRIYPESGSISFNATFPASFFNGQAGWAIRGLNAGDGWSRLNSSLVPPGDSLRVGFNDLLQGPSALSLYSLRPETPLVLGPDSLCALSTSVSYSVSNPQMGLNYLWNITGGALTAEEGPEVEINWGNQPPGVVAVIATAGNGCSSLSGSLPVTLHPLPSVDINFTAPEYPFAGEVWSFEAEYTGATIFYWESGGGLTGLGSSFNATYENVGGYIVNLVGESEFGCRDTAQAKITVLEGLEIPDSFSPNGDGVNDVFLLKNGGLEEIEVRIFDRWGNLVFGSNQTQTFWDGKSPGGELVPTGTYFLLLRALGDGTIYEKRGSITVFY